jgi:predicted nucleotidyltransferase
MLYTRQQLFDKLRELKPILYQKYGIRRIGVFGSYATGTQHEGSDVDLLVELTRPLGWEYFGLASRFEELLHTKVDVATENELKPRVKDEVIKQVIYIE